MGGTEECLDPCTLLVFRASCNATDHASHPWSKHCTGAGLVDDRSLNLPFQVQYQMEDIYLP